MMETNPPHLMNHLEPPLRSRSRPLVQELTPIPNLQDLCQKFQHLPHLLVLESVQGPDHLCSYSYLCADPFAWLQSRGTRVEYSDLINSLSSVWVEANPFLILAEQLNCQNMESLPGLPLYQGGAAGLFGYELCHHLENLPKAHHDEFAMPDMAVGFYDWVIAIDRHRHQAWLISSGRPEVEERSRLNRAQQRLKWVLDLVQKPIQESTSRYWKVVAPSAPKVLPAIGHEVPGLPGLLSNFDRVHYLETIDRAVEYIHAGDCFQVNIAQRLLYPLCHDPLKIYLRLRDRNPAPFAGYFDLGEFVLASSSPERFLRLEGDRVETRPIKGTRPRGANLAEEMANARELLNSAKDHAENVMIVDLLRNDLGRVCRYGSVAVAQVCRLETYQYVHHLVSEVRGRLRETLGAVDLLKAAFPGGSVTGAPKVRAMEIICELEQTARGPYCGSLGFIGFDGNMDSNILIRTFTIGKGWIQFSVGGGIVADSTAEQEYEETWHKAKGSLKALEE